MSKQVRIALDAMGGDYLATPNVQGAVHALIAAAKDKRDLKVILCGIRDQILSSVANSTSDGSSFSVDEAQFNSVLKSGQLEIIDCPQVVDMGESPATALRSKKESSLAKCFSLVKEGRADAALSAGNSGAVMAFGIATLGRLPDVKRPAILCHFPSSHGATVMLDAGANVDCTVEQLLQFGIMGMTYYSSAFSQPHPRVALMNIGEEESKGNEAVKAAHIEFKEKLGSNYIGFVEGRDLMNGKADVIVCDGFVGNVILKTAEGVASTIKNILRDEFKKSPITMLGALLSKKAFNTMKARLDYREYGAAPLVGLNGLGLVAHGSSDGKAIYNATLIAEKYVRQELVSTVRTAFEKFYKSTGTV